MSTAAVETYDWQELAQRRSSDGLQIILEWCKDKFGDIVQVKVVNERTAVETEFLVSPEKALDAFNHPFAYSMIEATEAFTPTASIETTQESE